jgi:pyruvate/2-oxoglutarate dehydrogenase complex dihydrolipoamide acyltransferase (E2) component
MLVKNCKTSHKILPFPKLRNFVLDVMREGRRQNTIYSLFDVDITEIRKTMKRYKNQTGSSLSLTSYIGRCLSVAIEEQKHMHAIRKGKKLVVFDDVDIAVMIEKEVEGFPQPVNYIIRSAQEKNFLEIQSELREAKETPIGKHMAMNRIEKIFFKCPTWLRKVFWWFSRRDPVLRKQFVGTVGLTSVGMFGSGFGWVLPITPMTVTVAIGTIKQIPEMGQYGELHNKEMLNIVLGVNHDIIDGGPMVRFQTRLKEIIESGMELPSFETFVHHLVEKPAKLKC